MVSTVTVIIHAKPGDSFDATDAQGNINLLNEAVSAGTRRFVFTSFDLDGVPEYPLQKTFSGLMLGVARGFGGGAGPASQYLPMKMTTVEEVVRGWAAPKT